MSAPFQYDPFAKDVMANPHPWYRELRANHPVYYLQKYDMFAFSRFDDIVELLSQGDNTFVASEQTLPSPSYMAAVHNEGAPAPLPLDPLPRSSNLPYPWYEQIRQAQIKPLRPSGVLAMEGMVRNLANQLLDKLLPQGEFNLTQDYGGIVAASIVCHLFGVPLEDAAIVRDSVNALTLSDPEQGGVNLERLVEDLVLLIQPAVERRRAAGADGLVPLVDGLINYRFEGRPLTDREVAMQGICVFVGGTETVPKITAHGLMELANAPGQLATVQANLDRNVPIAIEEFIRYCAPAQWFARTCHKDTVVAGQPIRAGQRVIALFGSAARDERHYDQPDDFVWDRKIGQVISFGFGQHHCIGAHIARMELRVLVDTFLRRVKSYEFDMGRSTLLPSSFQWGWNSLYVKIKELA